MTYADLLAAEENQDKATSRFLIWIGRVVVLCLCVALWAALIVGIAKLL